MFGSFTTFWTCTVDQVGTCFLGLRSRRHRFFLRYMGALLYSFSNVTFTVLCLKGCICTVNIQKAVDNGQ